MGTPEISSYNRKGMFEGPCKGTDPREMAAEDGRQILHTPRQPSACGDNLQPSRLEALFPGVIERLEQVEEEIRNRRVWFDSVDTRLQFLESCQGSLPARITRKDLQGKEENKKLKEQIKELEARNQELLSKAMSMHQHSENMNDPSRLSAVLQMYELLKLQEWGKLRSSTDSYLTYKNGSSIIKKLFDACEKDVGQRATNIFKVLDIPPSNDAMNNSMQEITKEIRNLLRHSYWINHSEFYNKIIMQTDIEVKTAIQSQFALQCCRIYCLLLLQDPPVKAMWNLKESLIQHLEHVDKKDWEHWRKPAFLWPIMKCGEQVIVRGVIWDEK